MRKTIALALYTILFSTAAIAADTPSGISMARKENSIQISLIVPENTKKLTFEYQSGRNLSISRLSDIADLNPHKSSRKVNGKEMWFPVVDLKLNSTMQAVAIFDNIQQTDTYCLNSNFHSGSHPLQSKLVIDRQLEHWENHLYIESDAAKLTRFYLTETIDIHANQNPNETYKHTIHTLTPDWFGTIAVFKQSENGKEKIQSIDVTQQPKPLNADRNADISKPELIRSLKETVRYILSCQNKNPLSPTYGGLFLFYDLDSKSYRRSDWIWTYGPAIQVLLKAAKIPELADEFGYEHLIESAKLIGEASLRFQFLKKDHPGYGLVMVRNSPKMIYTEGFTGYLSPADSLFLAGWGWMPLYEATADKRFLDASVLLNEQVGRILFYDDVIKQDFILKPEKWKNWTLDESGFGVEAFAEVYKITRDDRHKNIGKLYIDGLIDKLQRPNGLWYRKWYFNRDDHFSEVKKPNYPKGKPVLVKGTPITRGQGWAMIGLLASHRMMPQENVYLNKAKNMAQNIIDFQRPDGSWSFRLEDQSNTEEISEKGTPLWSMLLYQLYEFTNDAKHLEAAQKALKWCMKNQYSGPDRLAHGGIVGQTRASGVVYRPWYPMICTYTMDWFALALIEQIQLLESN